MMEVTDVLILSAEVSVAFAGFAGVIATFQFKNESSVRRGDVAGISVIVLESLSGAFFSAFALILLSYGIDDSTVWMIVSATGAVAIIGQALLVGKNMGAILRSKSQFFQFCLLSAPLLIVAFFLLLNALGIIFHREPGPVLTAIFAGQGLVGFMFARLLLRPLWRVVREQEEKIDLQRL